MTTPTLAADVLASLTHVGYVALVTNNPLLPACQATAFFKRLDNNSEGGFETGNDKTAVCPLPRSW